MAKNILNNNNSNCQVLLAPLQGLTDFHFRSTYHKFFTGIDTSYAPWIKLNHGKELKPSYIRDLQPKNNMGYKLIPQILTNNADDLIFLSNLIQGLGYDEINWNLGCPYPMVLNRGMGSALLTKPELVVEILERVMPIIHTKLSIKMRLGYEDNNDAYNMLPLLEAFPLHGIIIHARTALQMYKSEVNLEYFEKCTRQTSHELAYNGDINNYATFKDLQTRFPSIKKWMIGRGAIANPFLPQMIKNSSDEYPENYRKLFLEFHNALVESYANYLSGEGHLLIKMKSFWEYFSCPFTDPHKAYKRIKKSNNMKAYHSAVSINLEDGFGNKN